MAPSARHTAVPCLAAALAAFFLAACQNPQGAQPSTVAQQPTPALQDDPQRTPEDLTVDITIMSGSAMPESLKVEERTSRYILFPDGALHAESGPYLTQKSRPGRARWLYQQQIAQVWALCRQIGFADPSNANGPANPDMIRQARGERITIITLHANGQWWSYVRRALPDSKGDEASARLVRTLAALAWVPDFTPSDLQPDRYDYGPDPYAMYRTGRPAQVAP